MSSSSKATSSSLSSATSEQENKALASRFHMDIFQKGKLSLADQILTSDFILHNPVLPSDLTHGPEGIKKFASITVDTLPDRQFTHHETISKGDMVLIRWTLSGTPKNDILGVRASDKPIDITGFDLFRIKNGKIAEMWQQWNIGSWL
jgi:steroid delta-isomerase-like uncharacterized protein